MFLIDDVVFIFVLWYCWRGVVIVFLDNLNFLKFLKENYLVCVEMFVFGVYYKLMEVFVKVVGEDLIIGKCYLVVICFIIFVVILFYMNFESDF